MKAYDLMRRRKRALSRGGGGEPKGGGSELSPPQCIPRRSQGIITLECVKFLEQKKRLARTSEMVVSQYPLTHLPFFNYGKSLRGNMESRSNSLSRP
jgi:hypothetical protein